MKTILGLMATLCMSLSQSANAGGVYLFYFQNESKSTINIGARLPSGWVDTPRYPISVAPKHVLADERAHQEVQNSFAFYSCVSKQKDYQVHKIRNVALPTWCEKAAWPGPGDWKWVSIDGAKDYRLYECNGNVYVKKKVGRKWEHYTRQKYKSYAGIGIFWILMQSDGDLELHSTW